MTSSRAKLVFVDDSLPGITRRRAGTGWAYFDATGQKISDPAERQRLNAIALPPAYVDAWYCPADNGHILATGYDAKGRKQYRYHPDFRAERESHKFDGCVTFGSLLPLVRKRVDSDLAGRHATRERAVAGVVRLLDIGIIRVGNEQYAKTNKSFGATTLRQRHAKVSGTSLRLRYKGKSGVVRDLQLSDRRLAKVVRSMQDLPGQNLFQYLDDSGFAQPVTSSDVNAYLAETMGEAITAKSFRTWHASAMGYGLLARSSEKLTVKELTTAIAHELGNTPTVCRKSYIHPAVMSLIDTQEDFRASLRLPRATRWLTREERGLIELLQDAGSSHALIAAAAA